jgi:hypothetical protein
MAMTDLEMQGNVRRVIRIAPWYLFGAIVVGAVTCLFGLAPISYLLADVGIGFIWFVLMILIWRLRGKNLGFVPLCFVIFGQQINFDSLGGGRSFAIAQGFSVVIATMSGLVFLLRLWLYKFARVDAPPC